MEFKPCTMNDGVDLAELRARSMKPSLIAVGRFDEERVRSRFLSKFVPSDTIQIIVSRELAGFYVLKVNTDHVYLDHLYFEPKFQNRGYGSIVIERIKREATHLKLPIRLGALRDSPANQFYMRHGFCKTHEGEFDIYYEYLITG